MLITVWRHGEAGMAPRDEDRQLTQRGQLTVRGAALEFHERIAFANLPPPDLCLFSPLVRARETSQILAAEWGVTQQSCAALAPGTRVNQPETFVASDQEHQVLVSHQPFVSELIAHWIDGDEVAPLLPGGWATIDLVAPVRGGGSLVFARPSVYV